VGRDERHLSDVRRRPAAVTGRHAAAISKCKKKFPESPRRTKGIKKANKLPSDAPRKSSFPCKAAVLAVINGPGISGCPSPHPDSLWAVDREELRRELAAKLDIEEAHDDVRLVTLNGVVLGRLGQNRDSGYWELDWREGWRRLSSQHAGSGEAEHAETWAVEEIAGLMAVERSAIDAGKPWGKKSPPPGVS
jgi:hypothetical protein